MPGMGAQFFWVGKVLEHESAVQLEVKHLHAARNKTANLPRKALAIIPATFIILS